MKAILIHDDPNSAEVMALILRQAGLSVVVTHGGEKALDLWRQENPDLVLIDANRPGLDVLGICRTLRAESIVPIIVLSFEDEEGTILQTFDAGIDDYIIKPFSPRQLVARVRALLRRAGWVIPLAGVPGLTIAGLTLDPERRTVSLPAKPDVGLTNLEFRLLYCLMVNRGHVLTTEAIIEKVWGYSGQSDQNLLKGLVSRLRRKIEPEPQNSRYIKTVPGVGYTFSPSPDPG